MDISIIDFLTAPLFLAQDMGQGTGATDEKDSWIPLITNIGIVLAIFVLPFVVSHFVAKAVRMPDHAFKLGVMIAAGIRPAKFTPLPPGWLPGASARPMSPVSLCGHRWLPGWQLLPALAGHGGLPPFCSSSGALPSSPILRSFPPL